MRLLFIELVIMSFIMLFPSFGQIQNQPNSSIEELAQFKYMVGNWQIKMNSRQEDGTFKSLENTANVKAFYHTDGYSFQTIFTMENGFFSTDIRAYNIQENKWQIMFLNAKAQRWHKFSASIEKGNMTTEVVLKNWTVC